MGYLSRLALGSAATAVVACLPLAATATAASSPSAPPSPQASRMMLLLDSSGSMAQPAQDGRTKIADARSALRRVIDELPERTEVGLRVFGAEVFSRTDKGACSDTQQVIAPGTGNRDQLRRAVTAYKPYGETPIPAALKAGAQDLGSDGPRSLVLVSDGESTCGDPCPTARAVAGSGVDVRVDVVGLDVSGKARQQLRCIAAGGHGTYYDAHDAADLLHSLGASATRASRPFDLTGTPVRGTPAPTDAPTLGDGRYVDRLPPSGGRWYRVDRPVDHSTLHVGVTHYSTDWGNSGEKVAVKVYADPNGLECDSTMSFPLGRLGNTEATSWAKEPDNDCNTAATLYVHVEPVSSGLSGQPVQLAVYTEPPLTDPTGSLGAPPPVPHWSTLRPASPRPGGVPGTSLANAPVLPADGTYSFDINGGETQVVAVPLDWGQNLQVQLDADLPKDIGDQGPPRVAVSGPLGAKTSTDFYGTQPDPKDWTPYSPFLAGKHYRTGDQTLTTSYANRSSDVANVKGGALAGLRYVQVSYLGDGDPVDYTLTIKTNGTAGQDAPSYAAGTGLHPPAADAPLVGAGAAATSGSPSAAPPSAGSSRTAEKESGSGPALPALLGTAVLVVVVLGGIGWVLVRRRVR